jgi:hypothetical protein
MALTGRNRVDDRIWRNISIGLGVLCALLIGVAGALMIVGKGGEIAAGPTATPTTLASEGASPVPTEVVTAAPTPVYTGPATPTPNPSQSAALATVVFNGLTLDAAADKAGTIRTFVFQTDGIGPLNMSVVKTSPGGTTKMCAKVDTQAFACKIGSLPNFVKAFADTEKSTWTVTLQGYGASKPTVDLRLTWPTRAAKVTISHLRFQGSVTKGIAEGLNGFTATFTPRGLGAAGLQSSWTQVIANAEITLTDATATPFVKVDQRPYASATFIAPDYTFNVDSTKTYQLKLRNVSADSGERPDLTAQLSFP